MFFAYCKLTSIIFIECIENRGDYEYRGEDVRISSSFQSKNGYEMCVTPLLCGKGGGLSRRRLLLRNLDDQTRRSNGSVMTQWRVVGKVERRTRSEGLRLRCACWQPSPSTPHAAIDRVEVSVIYR
jgi:hypothetical protein